MQTFIFPICLFDDGGFLEEHAESLIENGNMPLIPLAGWFAWRDAAARGLAAALTEWAAIACTATLKVTVFALPSERSADPEPVFQISDHAAALLDERYPGAEYPEQSSDIDGLARRGWQVAMATGLLDTGDLETCPAGRIITYSDADAVCDRLHDAVIANQAEWSEPWQVLGDMAAARCPAVASAWAEHNRALARGRRADDYSAGLFAAVVAAARGA